MYQPIGLRNGPKNNCERKSHQNKIAVYEKIGVGGLDDFCSIGVLLELLASAVSLENYTWKLSIPLD